MRRIVLTLGIAIALTAAGASSALGDSRAHAALWHGSFGCDAFDTSGHARGGNVAFTRTGDVMDMTIRLRGGLADQLYEVYLYDDCSGYLAHTQLTTNSRGSAVLTWTAVSVSGHTSFTIDLVPSFGTDFVRTEPQSLP